ncbi:hypothetical protein CCP4SC76_2110002 [Gammaproteobacteria bacterium]
MSRLHRLVILPYLLCLVQFQNQIRRKKGMPEYLWSFVNTSILFIISLCFSKHVKLQFIHNIISHHHSQHN